MTKQRQTIPQQEGTSSTPAPHYAAGRISGQGLAFATLGGVMVLLMISFSNWREIDHIDERLDSRLSQIDARIAQVAEKVDKLPAQAGQPARRRGPDPNKVYKIKTAGAPAKGPASAPVTIAEFSDFQ